MMWKGVQMVGVKLIYLLRTVILARLLAPDDFGLLAISLIAVDFLMVITNIGMVQALVQQPETEEAHYNAAWTAGMVRGLFVTVAVIVAAPLIATLFKEPQAALLIQAAALRPTLEAAASIKLAQLTRNLGFRPLTVARLVDAIANTAVSIALAPIVGVWALIAGSLAGPLVYLAISYWLAPHRPRLSFEWEAVQPLIRFGRWIFLTGVIAIIGRTVMQMILTRELGIAELGLYYLAAKLAFLPSEVSDEVINSVAFPVYANLQDSPSDLARAYRAILVAMVALILPICVLLFALTPGLVTYVLGPTWAGTVELIRVLALVNILGLLGETVNPILNGTGRPQFVAVIECLQSTLLVTLSAPLIGVFGVLGAALVWLPAVGSSQVLSAIFVRRILPRPFQGVFGAIVTIAAVAIVGGLLGATVMNLLPSLVGLIVAGGAALLVMAALLWLADQALHLGLQANLVQAFPPLARLRFLNGEV